MTKITVCDLGSTVGVRDIFIEVGNDLLSYCQGTLSDISYVCSTS